MELVQLPCDLCRRQLRTLSWEMDMRRLMWRALVEECGQDLIEYAMLTSSVSVAAIGAILSVGDGVAALWDRVAEKMPAAPRTGF